MAAEHDAAAAAIVRSLTGGRWTWPPVRVRELYPAPTGKLLLRGRPVNTIISVKRYSDQADLEYTQFKNGLVELTGPTSWCRGGEARVDVTYEYGSQPSTIFQRAIDILAEELVLADAESGDCRLPERVTSVSRQGVSWTVIDPQDFLDKGRTGIAEIDQILATAGKAKKRARVFSPEFPPPERVSTLVLEPAP